MSPRPSKRGTIGFVTEPLGTRILLASSVGVLVLATMVWMSGSDMFFGSMLFLVVAGWGLLAVYGLISFARAARHRAGHWLQEWALVWLGCAVVFVGSLGVGVAGVPEDVRIRLSRDALIDAGQRVLAGEHPSRAGLYGFGRTTVVGECAMLEIGTIAVDSFGFAYCPAAAPPAFEHVNGALYRYAYD
jgi:hypothetical protein